MSYTAQLSGSTFHSGELYNTTEWWYFHSCELNNITEWWYFHSRELYNTTELTHELSDVRKVWLYCQNWPNLSGRHQPGQTRYLRISLLHRCPPYACGSLCILLRLPPWRDVAAELDAAVLLETDCCSSSAWIFRTLA